MRVVAIVIFIILTVALVYLFIRIIIIMRCATIKIMDAIKKLKYAQILHVNVLNGEIDGWS